MNADSDIVNVDSDIVNAHSDDSRKSFTFARNQCSRSVGIAVHDHSEYANAVLEWYVLHQDELMANWEAAENRKPLSKIEPLE